MTTTAPPYPDEPTAIDIILTVEYAKHAIAQVCRAVEAVTNDDRVDGCGEGSAP